MPRANSKLTFAGACAQIETALSAPVRQHIAADLAATNSFTSALVRLRAGMRSNEWRLPSGAIRLDSIVSRYDGQTRRDGFHALHDWDGIADRVNDDTIPVDVLNFLLDQRGGEPCDVAALAILLDYYFLYLLALLSLKIWDEGSADDNLDQLARLLDCLQGSGGSGHRFADDAETLLLIATSHYELYDGAYDRLLDRVRGLNDAHRLNIAIGHAASLGSHLRFGFEATYGRDTVHMRNDNVADYPWLAFSLATLMREYARIQRGDAAQRRRETITEAIVNGLSPDARAFVGTHPPPSLAAGANELKEFQDLFASHRQDLLREFECHRPTGEAYSPMSFFFNFSHNVLKGAVVDAVLRGRPWDVTLNDLFTALPRDSARATSKEALARVLMGYARANPDRIRGRLTPVIVYDPQAGRQAFSVALQKIKEHDGMSMR
jgi:hypothetical protein